jgi:hypothetical protein
VTQCYDCGQRITQPEKARPCVLGDDEHVVVLCLGCRPNRPSNFVDLEFQVPEVRGRDRDDGLVKREKITW